MLIAILLFVDIQIYSSFIKPKLIAILLYDTISKVS